MYFCGFKLSLNKGKENICVIKSTAVPEKIVKICHERNDEWATEVLSKMEGIVDCLATGMKYDINCSINFRKKKQNKTKHLFILQSVLSMEKESKEKVLNIQ